MNTQPPAERKTGAFASALWIAAAFVVFSLVLWFVHRGPQQEDLQFVVRAGILRDLVAEDSLGRQALVSSLVVMPMPTLVALLFVPFVSPHAYGLAYLYGLAMLLAFGILPLAALLRRMRIPASRAVSLVILSVLAATVGATSFSDALACIAFLLMALALDTDKRPMLRGLAGACYGFALFSHPAGIAISLLRLLFLARHSILPGSSGERRAVAWIQGSCIVYAALIYIFLVWMIMGSASYSVRQTNPDMRILLRRDNVQHILQGVAAAYPESAMVVNGHWGYLAEDVLNSRGGYRFIHIHHGNVPRWDSRPVVLVVPKKTNKLSVFAERTTPGLYARLGYLLLREDADFSYYTTSREGNK
ncbi:MAG: hypothetical protein C0404_03905 [Verrucomicrobia bacterium]|nr:hypothetical protein [Verrucomicrobiota bacterium]